MRLSLFSVLPVPGGAVAVAFAGSSGGSSSSSSYELLEQSSSPIKENMLWDDGIFGLYDDYNDQYYRRRAQDGERFVIESCEDVFGYWSAGRVRTRGINSTAFFSFFHCTCSGDFTSNFEMSCHYKRVRCFQPYVPLGEEEDAERPFYCVNRTYNVEFRVQEGDRNIGTPDYYVPWHEMTCHEYIDGPGAGNTICIQLYGSCVLQLREFHQLWLEEAVETCRDLDICRESLPDLGYSTEDTERLCFRRFWNGQECLSKPAVLDECRGAIDRNRTEIEVAVPDCSDVEPCAMTTCHIQPYDYTTPDDVSLYYTECSTSMTQEEEEEEEEEEEMLAPVPTISEPPPTGTTENGDSLFVIESCEDVPGWLSTRRTSSTAFFETFFDCTCSGDFTSNFEMSCHYKRVRCFQSYVPLGEEEDAERPFFCVNRTYNIEFRVQEDDRNVGTRDYYVPWHDMACHEYIDGPGAGNTICIQTSNSCSYQLREYHMFSTEFAAETCNNLDICRESLPDLGYSTEDTERLCFRRFWNGQECLSKPAVLDECRGAIDRNRTEIEVAVPDCSDVEPCAMATCRIQPYDYTTPDDVSLYYTECSTSMTQEEEEEEEEEEETLAPVPTISEPPPTGTTENGDSLFVIESCEDVPGWLSTRRTSSTAFFETFFDCTCSGDFTSNFEMSCHYKRVRCFQSYVPLGEEEDAERPFFCVNRTYNIEFRVQEDDRNVGTRDYYVPWHDMACHEYIDGPGAGNTICIQTSSPCAYQLREFHEFSTEFAAKTCSDLDVCRELLPNLGYSTEDTERLCFRRFWNGRECLSKPAVLDECRGVIDRNRTEIEVAWPGCSDVEPCATATCRIQPYDYTTPDDVSLYYTECSTNMTQGEEENKEDETLALVPAISEPSPTNTIKSGGNNIFQEQEEEEEPTLAPIPATPEPSATTTIESGGFSSLFSNLTNQSTTNTDSTRIQSGSTNMTREQEEEEEEEPPLASVPATLELSPTDAIESGGSSSLNFSLAKQATTNAAIMSIALLLWMFL